MTIIISVLNPKGGSGKTTISTNIAFSIHKKGYSVLLVDSDPQGSARDWHASTENNPIPLISLDRPNNMKNISNLAREYDYVIIDGAAKLEDMIASTIKISDFILIPVQPSPYDLWAVSDLVEFIKARQEVTDGKPLSAFVISRAIQGTKLGSEITKALNEYDLKLCKTNLTQRQVYPQTASEGLSIFDSFNTDAIAEINNLTNEIIETIQTKKLEKVTP
jgi:chromosome partitioning protein